MNRENVEKLIAKLESIPDRRFDMECYFSAENGFTPTDIVRRGASCGTAACLAGWAVVLQNRPDLVDQVGVEGAAREWLGIGPVAASDMFRPFGFFNRDVKRRYTRELAIKMLRRFLETGSVENWWTNED